MVVWMSRCCTTFAFAFFSIIINYWAVLLVATKSHIWIRNPATLLFHISKNLSIRPNRCMHKTEENRKKKVLTKLCAASHQAGNINQKAPPRFNSIIIIIIDTIIFHLRAFCTLATVTTMDGTDEHSIMKSLGNSIQCKMFKILSCCWRLKQKKHSHAYSNSSTWLWYGWSWNVRIMQYLDGTVGNWTASSWHH